MDLFVYLLSTLFISECFQSIIWHLQVETDHQVAQAQQVRQDREVGQVTPAWLDLGAYLASLERKVSVFQNCTICVQYNMATAFVVVFEPK